jgi:hypothetical protein
MEEQRVLWRKKLVIFAKVGDLPFSCLFTFGRSRRKQSRTSLSGRRTESPAAMFLAEGQAVQEKRDVVAAVQAESSVNPLFIHTSIGQFKDKTGN